MTITDKRQHPRIDSLNLISYVCIDETDTDVIQGMGRTLNVSEGGILLETHIQIDSKHTLSLTIGLEEDLVDIKGEVAHSKPGKDDNFVTGIQFFETDEEALRVLKKYVKAFKEQFNSTP
jgi:hypothetical protein